MGRASLLARDGAMGRYGLCQQIVHSVLRAVLRAMAAIMIKVLWESSIAALNGASWSAGSSSPVFLPQSI
jgi:hypothetical protein